VTRRLAGGRVLLVDDVATTGRTLAGAAGSLHAAGAARVEVATLAITGRAITPQNPPSGVASRDP
jgi:predicted amidophosphoribosyltransferase